MLSDDCHEVVPVEHLPQPGKVVAIYDYTDETGRLLFQIVRHQPKSFRTRRPDDRGGWIWKITGCKRMLYRLTDVIRADTILILEGEKDVETAIRLGLPDGWAATSSPFGACQWLNQYSEVLRGKQIIICPDTDSYGQQHLMQVGLSLVGKAVNIRVVCLPGAVKDLTEWVGNGGQPQQFIRLLQQAPLFDYPRFDTGLKTNIQPLKGALKKLLQLCGVTYEWKQPEAQANLTGPQMGLISQEVESVFPEWVGVDPTGYQTLAITGFEALSIEAIKELKAKSKAVTLRVQALETKLKALEESSRELNNRE